MIIFQVLLITLVAAPVLVLAFYMWNQIRLYVRNKNLQDSARIASESRSGKRRKRR